VSGDTHTIISFGGIQVLGGLGDDLIGVEDTGFSVPGKVFAGSGNDTIFTSSFGFSSGSSLIYGGSGNDTIISGINNDTIAQVGNDTLITNSNVILWEFSKDIQVHSVWYRSGSKTFT
jgi:Ca2+-binding RTX toxin-like protein